MMRDAQRIEHMLNFVRRSLEILDGVDQAEFIAAIGLQEQVEVNMIHLGEAAARMSDEKRKASRYSVARNGWDEECLDPRVLSCETDHLVRDRDLTVQIAGTSAGRIANRISVIQSQTVKQQMKGKTISS